MSEFSKAIDFVQKQNSNTRIENHLYEMGQRYVFSGDSVYKNSIITRCFYKMNNVGKIILTQNSENSIWKSNRNGVVIRNNMYSDIYNPFKGYKNDKIFQMMHKLPGFDSLSPVACNLLRRLCFIIELDNSFFSSFSGYSSLEEIINDRVSYLHNNGKIDNNMYERIIDAVDSRFSDLDELESFFYNISHIINRVSRNSGFRVSHSLAEDIARNKEIYFVFDNNLSSSDAFDSVLIALLSCDIEQSLIGKEFCFVIDDLPYSYVEPFEWIFSYSNVISILNLCKNANYYSEDKYSRLIRSQFDYYMIFVHKDSKMCQFWSDAFGTGRFIEYNFNNTNSYTDRLPIPRSLNEMLGNKQISEATGYHYVDKNIHPDYEIRNLNAKTFFLYDKKNNTITKTSYLQ